MTSLRSLMSALFATALLALVGCGGGDGDTPADPVQVDSARTERATLGPAGGTLVATAADGRRYTLTVEPGALATDTEITATPVLSMGSAPLAAGLKGAVRFAPSGLRFALPAMLRIEGASLATSTGSHLVGFLRSADGASMQLVPATVAAAGTIEMEVRHFSDVGVSQATAEQLAQVPIDPNETPEDGLWSEFAAGFFGAPDEAAQIAFMVRLHDTRVVPRLTVAELRTVATDTEREMAILVARAWIDTTVNAFEVLPASLDPLLTAMRQRVAAVIKEDFDIGLAACMGPAPIGSAQLVGLLNALRTREQIGLFREVGGLPGLDRETAQRQLNDCVRVVFEPRPLPTFEIGRPVSLDLRARLVFAADPNASIDVPFEFDVYSPGSSGPVFGTEFISFGSSDAQGNYTTVVTPRDAEPEFLAEACMVVSLRNGGPVGSALCGQQTLRGASPNAITTRSILLQASVMDGTGLVGQQESDDGLAGGFIRVAETSGTFLDVPQSTRAASTEDTMGEAGGAVALNISCSGDVVGGRAFSVVRFSLARETRVTVNGSLTASGRNFNGGVFLENRTVATNHVSRELSDTLRNITVDETLLLPPADYTLRLTMSHGCGIVIGRPTTGSVQGRISLSFAP